MSQERWAAVPDLPGYEVSSLGRARSWVPQGSMPLPKMLRVRVGHNGYPKFNCVRDGRAETMDVHRAMGLAFLGPPPSPVHHVDHIDTVRTNCVVDNLEWKTPAENARTMLRRRTSTELKREVFLRRLFSNESYGRLAMRFGIDHRTVRRYVAASPFSKAA